MNATDFIFQIVNDYTVRTISLGTAITGVICGILGSFAVLRKQSLLGDAISHASLPGIVIAYLITGSKEPLVLFTGALVSGLTGTLWIMLIVSKTHLKSDTALGIILSVFFGIGMLLLSHMQKMPDANQAGLDKFLFGQAATLMLRDVYVLSAAGGLALSIVLIFYKEFKILAFDPQYARTIGFNTLVLDIILTSLIVLAIVVGLQIVGVVLMSAMLLAPAAAARQWTNRLSVMLILAASFGAFSGVAGTAISSSMANLSTGPVIVLIASGVVIISFIFGWERGLALRFIRKIKNRNYQLSDEPGTN
jgi:manganese/zinc/iron transport system permease protein